MFYTNTTDEKQRAYNIAIDDTSEPIPVSAACDSNIIEQEDVTDSTTSESAATVQILLWCLQGIIQKEVINHLWDLLCSRSYI